MGAIKFALLVVLCFMCYVESVCPSSLISNSSLFCYFDAKWNGRRSEGVGKKERRQRGRKGGRKEGRNERKREKYIANMLIQTPRPKVVPSGTHVEVVGNTHMLINHPDGSTSLNRLAPKPRFVLKKLKLKKKRIVKLNQKVPPISFLYVFSLIFRST